MTSVPLNRQPWILPGSVKARVRPGSLAAGTGTQAVEKDLKDNICQSEQHLDYYMYF